MEKQEIIVDLHFFDGEVATTSETVSDNNASNEVSTQETSNATEDLNAKFDELIKGEYKDVYGKKVQATIDSRLKNAKKTEAELTNKLQSYEPLLNQLAVKYGIFDGDVAKIQEAMSKDNSYIEEEADRQGITVEQLKHIREMERQNQEFANFKAEQERIKASEMQYNKFLQEAEKVKEIYADFDLRNECQNKQFLDLLSNNVDMVSAYRMVHFEEIMNNSTTQAQQQVVNNIKARGQRPSENGLNANVGKLANTSFKDMNSKDFNNYVAEMQRRLEKGEIISNL